MRRVIHATMAGFATVGIAGATLAGCGGAASPVQERCRLEGVGPRAELAALAAACERALPAIGRLWPQWTGSAHIVRSDVPLESGTAAFVEGMARPGEPAQEDRLVVAPGLADELSSAGLDVVLRHELTHLAMRATGTATIPLWVAEGLAEHAGYASVADLRSERREELLQLHERVVAGSWTGSVPKDDDFAASGERADAYTAAWLGIEALIGRHGLAAVTAAVRGAGPDDPARHDPDGLLHRMGETPASLGSLWHEELVRRISAVD